MASFVVHLIPPSFVVHLIPPSFVVHLIPPSFVVHLIPPSFVVHLIPPSFVEVVYFARQSYDYRALCTASHGGSISRPSGRPGTNEARVAL
jgi:hypothetical protein